MCDERARATAKLFNLFFSLVNNKKRYHLILNIYVLGKPNSPHHGNRSFQ